MYLVSTFDLFEIQALYESIEMDDRDDNNLLLLFDGLFFYYLTESGLIQCSSIALLN